MKEIMFPVQVLDEDCRTCEFLNIESYIKYQMWADDKCVNQDIVIQCKDLVKCEKMLKKLEKKGEAGHERDKEEGEPDDEKILPV